MAQKGRTGILRAHAAAVVSNPQEGHSAVTDLHSDLRSACIHGVFQQFLHHAGRTLHHLTGGY